jgi:hypothetical protein
MTKMGRPLVLGKRQSKLIGLRLTIHEYRELRASAREADLAVSDYIRQKLGFRSEP